MAIGRLTDANETLRRALGICTLSAILFLVDWLSAGWRSKSARGALVPKIAPPRGRACFAREGKRTRGKIRCESAPAASRGSGGHRNRQAAGTIN